MGRKDASRNSLPKPRDAGKEALPHQTQRGRRQLSGTCSPMAIYGCATWKYSRAYRRVFVSGTRKKAIPSQSLENGRLWSIADERMVSADLANFAP